MNWHLMSVEAVVEALNTSRQGINAEEARRRLATHGPNMLTEGRRRSPLRMFLDQFTDFMILVLLAAAVVSGLIGEAKDTIAIMAIVVLNAVIGFVRDDADAARGTDGSDRRELGIGDHGPGRIRRTRQDESRGCRVERGNHGGCRLETRLPAAIHLHRLEPERV